MYRPVTDRPFIRSIRESEQTMKLYVGNLPFSFGSENLRALFAPLGEVTSAEVLSDRETGRSRGFGFVEMSDEDGRKAIDQLDGSDVDGRRLTVNEAKPRSTSGSGFGAGGRPGGGYQGNRDRSGGRPSGGPNRSGNRRNGR